MPNPMCGRISAHDRHLYIHEDDVWLGMFGRGLFKKIFESLLTVPYSVTRESEFLNRSKGNLLIDGTATLSLES